MNFLVDDLFSITSQSVGWAICSWHRVWTRVAHDQIELMWWLPSKRYWLTFFYSVAILQLSKYQRLKPSPVRKEQCSKFNITQQNLTIRKKVVRRSFVLSVSYFKTHKKLSLKGVSIMGIHQVMVLQKCNNDTILFAREATIICWELFAVSVNSRKSCNQQFQWVSSDSVKCRYHHEESFPVKLSKWECQNTTIRRYRNGSPLILWNCEVNKKLLRLVLTIESLIDKTKLQNKWRNFLSCISWVMN